MTTTSLPTAWNQLHDALHTQRPVWISYHGRRRLICPHALGWTNNRPLLLGYQTGGETSTGHLDHDPGKRWRCMHIDEIDDITATDTTTPWGTAPNYNPTRPFASGAQIATAIGHP